MGLIVQIVGGDPTGQSSRTIAEGETLRLGRTSKLGWAIPNDPAISREHADLSVKEQRLHVQCLTTATNPVLLNGEAVRSAVLVPGESFRIGNTSFIVDVLPATAGEKAASVAYQNEEATEYSFSFEALRKVAFRNAVRQMEILDQLPQRISAASTDQELGRMLSELLLEAIPPALAVAVACYDESLLPIDNAHIDAFPQPTSMQVETRDSFAERFTPSRRMILKCLRTQNSVMHIFERNVTGEFTLNSELGWAFCTPIKAESNQGWCLYVSGRGGGSGLVLTENDLLGDLRFTQLVAQFIGSIRQVRWLQEQRTQLSNFFSPKIIEGITHANTKESLQPAERPITVLFCDVRGFSRKSEQLQNDLPALLKSVSAALDVMAGGIVSHDGAIADFQGDAALGFWGWPLEQADGPLPACRAALAMAEAFHQSSQDDESLLHGFSIGIGIAFGRALAGQIGTSNQSKIGVFGPVVNQGARLEGLTRPLGVTICLDEPTAQVVRASLSPQEARLRRLVRVRPKGMETAITVYALVPAFEFLTQITEAMLADYDAAVEAVIQGDWSQAVQLLKSLPVNDGPTQFLLSQMHALGDVPPSDWNGAFLLQSK